MLGGFINHKETSFCPQNACNLKFEKRSSVKSKYQEYEAVSRVKKTGLVDEVRTLWKMWLSFSHFAFLNMGARNIAFL